MTVDPDPIRLFLRWQQRARAEPKTGYIFKTIGVFARRLLRSVVGELPNADAAALATVSPDGQPTVRLVLVKKASADGFVFYTNRTSVKARDLQTNPLAALAFHWPFPPRQVRVEGPTTPLSAEENDQYWRSRPRGSQLGALVSRQSMVISGPEELNRLLDRARQRWAGRSIPCPWFWGGYRLVPQRIEFWQGRIDRLHERWQYVRDDTGWRPSWLAP